MEWRDLLPLTRREVVCETLIAAPWLAGSLVGWHLAETFHRGFAAAALLSAFFFFLTGLRQVHNAYHHALGLGRWLTDLTMVALSVSMLSAMHRTGWALAGQRGRRWIVVEVVAIVATVAAVTTIDSFPLRAHVLSMLAGQCFTAFFAVWTVHHGCASAKRIARTQRGWLKNVISYDMFHHVEHHLFPAVPTCHLPELSRRLDRVAPDYKHLTVY